MVFKLFLDTLENCPCIHFYVTTQVITHTSNKNSLVTTCLSPSFAYCYWESTAATFPVRVVCLHFTNFLPFLVVANKNLYTDFCIPLSQPASPLLRLAQNCIFIWRMASLSIVLCFLFGIFIRVSHPFSANI